MLGDFLATLEFPWLAGLSVVAALFALPTLVRFFYGNTYQDATRELGVGDPIQRQIAVLGFLLYGRWWLWSFRAIAFVAVFLLIAGFTYLVLAGVARAIQ
jgi:hypothetical protein